MSGLVSHSGLPNILVAEGEDRSKTRGEIICREGERTDLGFDCKYDTNQSTNKTLLGS